MKYVIHLVLIFLVTVLSFGCDGSSGGGCGRNDEEPVDDLPTELAGVSHFVQATIRIEGDLTIYFDPYQFPEELHDADVIFITHSHSDHFSAADISKVSNADTVIVAPESMAQNVAKLGMSEVQTVIPGSQYSVKGISFETTFAYNTGSFVRHPESNNWVGYIVTINDKRYYIAGDTNFIPEIESVTADVVFLPVGGGSSMDAQEAATAAAAIMPSVAVPIHYGVTAGNLNSAKQFVELLAPGIAGYIYSDDGELLP
jgi:L-ascorbate metabolism protein UlaG (beta-lactamase superfamily)